MDKHNMTLTIEWGGQTEFVTLEFQHVATDTICSVKFDNESLPWPFVGLAHKHPKDEHDPFIGMKIAAKYACLRMPRGKANGMGELGKRIYRAARTIITISKEQGCTLDDVCKTFNALAQQTENILEGDDKESNRVS